MNVLIKTAVIILFLGMFSAGAMASAADAGEMVAINLPVYFTENQGQKDPAVLFHAETGGISLYFCKERVILFTPDPNSGAVSTVSIELAGAEPSVSVSGEEPLTGRTNFLLGNDETQWITDVPTYGAVAYKGIYPWIDLVYRGDQGTLKREFVVHPGGDPGIIKMQYRGQAGISITEDGTLVVTTPAGSLYETPPYCYQERDGQRTAVPCSFTLTGSDKVGFMIGEYDRALPLVIDPVLDFSTYLGGNKDDRALAIAVDPIGDIYVTGYTESTNFPLPLAPVYQQHLNSSRDVFVSKLKSDGSQLIYSTYIGGFGDDVAQGIAVDSGGYATITGYTYSSNYPNVSAYQPTLSNAADAFVTRLFPNGSALYFSTYLGGNNSEFATAIALTPGGTAAITGYTDSNDFPTMGPYQSNFGGGTDLFVSGFDQTTGNLLFSTYMGGIGYDVGSGIAFDSTTNIFVTGSSNGYGFNTTPGAFRINTAGQKDAIITKFDPSASSLIYSTFLGGTKDDLGKAIAVDLAGDAYVTGCTNSPNTFPVTPGAFQPLNAGKWDVFVTKMSNLGDYPNYSTYIGGIEDEKGYGIVVDANNTAYITGYTLSKEYPVRQAYQKDRNGLVQDAFLTQVNANGTNLKYSTYYGGSYYDEGYGIAIDPAGVNITFAGYTESFDFPTKHAIQSSLSGFPNVRYSDAFIARFVRVFPNADFNGTPQVGFKPLNVSFMDNSTGNIQSYLWDFGEGNTSTDMNPNHTYALEGNYTVNLTVTGTDGSDMESKFEYIKVGNVTVDFKANQTSGCINATYPNFTVHFVDQTIGTITGRNWSMDNGDYRTAAIFNYNFNVSRTYNVTLTVFTFWGNKSISKTITVGEAPVANFNVTPMVGFAPLPVQFNDTSTGVPTSWTWKFTDSSPNVTGIQNATYTYTTPGVYNVTLWVSNPCGSDRLKRAFVVTVGAPLVPNFTGDPTSGTDPLEVNFTDSTTGAPDYWNWSFGDGSTPVNATTNASVLHTYTEEGIYNVSLTVSNPNGSVTFTRPNYIIVGARPNLSFVPGNVTIPTNATTPIKLYLDRADNGLSGYNISIFFTDTNGGNITAVTFPSWAMNQTLIGPVPGPIVGLVATDITDQIGPGSTNILLASFNTTGRNPMPTFLNVTVNQMDDDSGNPIASRSIPAQVTVVRLLPLPGKVNPPTDPDHDQLFWDVSGNGKIDFADVTLYFNNMGWISANEPRSLFDYNRNGIIDFNDLILLFHKV